MEINKVKELVSAFKEAELTSLSLKCDEFELKLKKEVMMITPNGVGYGQVDNNSVPCHATVLEQEAKEKAIDTEKPNGQSCSYSNEGRQIRNEDKQARLEETVLSEKAASVESTQAKSTVAKGIKAPMVGTFYSASGPDAKPFVKVGDYVKKGDIVCVIEAMKLMNEVEAEEDGEIVEILVNNEDMVEYGQNLFMVR